MPLAQVSNEVEQLRLLSRVLTTTWSEGTVWGVSPAEAVASPWPASPLHQCWLSLGLAFLGQGQPLDVVRVMDQTYHNFKQGAAAPLTEEGVETLFRATPSGSILAACLGLLSPSPEHRREAVTSFEVSPEDEYQLPLTVSANPANPLPHRCCSLMALRSHTKPSTCRAASSWQP